MDKDFEALNDEFTVEEKQLFSNLCINLKNKTECFEDKELYQIFDGLDYEEKGVIELKRVKYFLYIFRSELNKYHLDPLIQKICKSNVIYINRDEFVEEMKYGYIDNDNYDVSEYKEIFNLLDADHDGKLGVEDIKNALQLLGEELFDNYQCQKIVNLIEGQNDGITYNTFYKILKEENL